MLGQLTFALELNGVGARLLSNISCFSLRRQPSPVFTAGFLLSTPRRISPPASPHDGRGFHPQEGESRDDKERGDTQPHGGRVG